MHRQHVKCYVVQLADLHQRCYTRMLPQSQNGSVRTSRLICYSKDVSTESFPGREAFLFQFICRLASIMKDLSTRAGGGRVCPRRGPVCGDSVAGGGRLIRLLVAGRGSGGSTAVTVGCTAEQHFRPWLLLLPPTRPGEPGGAPSFIPSPQQPCQKTGDVAVD